MCWRASISIPFGWRLFVGSALTYYYCLMVVFRFVSFGSACVCAYMFSFHFRSVAGWWAQITVYNSAFHHIQAYYLWARRVFSFPHIVCVCARDFLYVCSVHHHRFVLTFTCPYLVIMQSGTMLTNPTETRALPMDGWLVCLHAFRNHCLPFANGKINVCDELESAILSHICICLPTHTHAKTHSLTLARTSAATTTTTIHFSHTWWMPFTLVSHSCSLYSVHSTLTIERYAMFSNGKSIFSVGDDDAVVGRLGNRFSSHHRTCSFAFFLLSLSAPSWYRCILARMCAHMITALRSVVMCILELAWARGWT